jgi:lauroyl/myristoyl acyltransferase
MARLRGLVTLHGQEHLASASARGHGVVLAGAHLSSISLIGHIVPAHGYTMTSMLEPIQPQRLFDFFARQRSGLGLRMLPAGAPGLRELVAALRRNEVIGVVTDREVSGTGPIVQFFDAPTRFADGLPALSIRTGAPLLPGIGVRRADGTFEAIIEPPIAIDRSGDTKRDIYALTQAMARRLEYHVANHPEQWTVFQKRWP